MTKFRFQEIWVEICHYCFPKFLVLIVIVIIGLAIFTPIAPKQENMNVRAAIYVRSIVDRQAQYAARHQGDFGTFDELRAETGFNENFKGQKPVVDGYVYTLRVNKKTASQKSSYTINADPELPIWPMLISRHYFGGSDLPNIRVSEEGPATKDSPTYAFTW